MDFKTIALANPLGGLVLGNLSFLNKKSKRLVFYCVLIGVILFSFSIYLLATNPLTSMDFKTIALATPLGGLFLISGWIVLGYSAFKDI